MSAWGCLTGLLGRHPRWADTPPGESDGSELYLARHPSRACTPCTDSRGSRPHPDHRTRGDDPGVAIAAQWLAMLATGTKRPR
jgi:hypothetical protein